MAGTGLVYTPRSERLAQFCFPPGTRREVAIRRIEIEGPRWLERICREESLEVIEDPVYVGPYFCPLVESYGDDWWILKAIVKSKGYREVDEDFLWAQQEFRADLIADLNLQAKTIIAERDDKHIEEIPDFDPELLMPTPKMHHAMPEDFAEQMAFVQHNADAVYDDLREAPGRYEEAHNAGEI